MDKSDAIPAVRSYVLDHAAGVIWIAAALVAKGVRLDALASPPLKDILSSASGGITVLLIAAAVVVPLSVSLVLKPVSFEVMNQARNARRRIRRWRNRGKPKPGVDVGAVLQTAIDARFVALLGCAPRSRGAKVAFLRAYAVPTALWLEHVKDNIWFLANIVPAATLLVAAAAWRALPGWIGSVLGLLLGVLSFAFASSFINGFLDEFNEQLNISVLLVDGGEENDDPKKRAANDPGDELLGDASKD